MELSYNQKKTLLAKTLHELAVNTQTFTSCINCNSWNETEEKCKFNNLRPPAHIIVFGCELHDYDIPF